MARAPVLRLTDGKAWPISPGASPRRMVSPSPSSPNSLSPQHFTAPSAPSAHTRMPRAVIAVGSQVQAAEQPSPLTTLPSSHSSPASSCWLPHTAVTQLAELPEQAPAALGLPPAPAAAELDVPPAPPELVAKAYSSLRAPQPAPPQIAAKPIQKWVECPGMTSLGTCACRRSLSRARACRESAASRSIPRAAQRTAESAPARAARSV